MELILIDNQNVNIPSDIVATIGSFDGLHIAHGILINKTIEIAKENNLKSAIITFDPHPDFVLNFRNDESYLTPLNEKIKLLEQYGIDYLIIIKFTKELANTDYIDFYNTFLSQIEEIVVGYDFTFGKFGKGTANILKQMHHNKVIVIDEITFNDEKIGSKLIRDLLINGKIKDIKNILGRYYRINGQVVEGAKLGRTIGYKTANILIDKEFYPIKNGVYSVLVIYNNKSYLGIANVGHNPSFNYVKNVRLEVHIFNFEENIYNKNIDVDFLDYLREEKVYSSKEELKEQLDKDSKYTQEEFKELL